MDILTKIETLVWMRFENAEEMFVFMLERALE